MRSLAEIVHLRTGDCRAAAAAITQIAAGEDYGVAPSASVHVAQCLRCQAEVAAYRRVVRSMRTMAGDQMETPAGGVAAVVAALGVAAGNQAGGPATWVVKAAYVSGITVATAAAGAAGLLVWMSRRRLPETL
jgi:hypothetical protein